MFIEGLKEDYWQILEYYGQVFAEPKKKPWKQSGTVKPYPSRSNQLQSHKKTKSRSFHQKLYGESFSENRGKKKGILKDSLKLPEAENGIRKLHL